MTHDRFCVVQGAIDSFRAAALRVVDEPVEDLAAEMAHADGVGVGKSDRYAYIGFLPIAVGDKLVDFPANILAGLPDKWEQVMANAFRQSFHFFRPITKDEIIALAI